jgi:glycosyltransferase involved in cell wall biosynthesis
MQPFWDKTLTDPHPWQRDIDDSMLRRRILGEFDDHAKKSNVLISQMCHFPAALCEIVRMKVENNLPLVSEIDDDIFHTPTYNPANVAYKQGSGLPFRQTAIDQFKMSDAMIVSTPYLKEVYGELCPNIYVVPNSLDFRIWDNLKHKRNKDVIRIGWSGGASHENDLKIIESVVHKTLAKHPTVVFCFVHGVPEFLKGIDRVEAVALGNDFVRIDRYPQFLASRGFDIGIAPLVDNSFNRGKSNLRWLEYAGLKVPCVASRVGHFAETITQAEDGLLCDSEQDWLDSLDFLIHDENARRKMGKNANQKARRDFNVDVNIQSYRNALEEIADRGLVVKMPETKEATA